MDALLDELNQDFTETCIPKAVHEAKTIAELRAALKDARAATETTVIVIETDPLAAVPSYGWWEVVPAEVSEQEGVRKARQEWAAAKKGQRRLL